MGVRKQSNLDQRRQQDNPALRPQKEYLLPRRQTNDHNQTHLIKDHLRRLLIKYRARSSPAMHQRPHCRPP